MDKEGRKEGNRKRPPPLGSCSWGPPPPLPPKPPLSPILLRESTTLLHSPHEDPSLGSALEDTRGGRIRSWSCLQAPPSPEPHSGPRLSPVTFLYRFPRANQPACHPPPPGTAAPLLSPWIFRKGLTWFLSSTSSLLRWLSRL